MKRNKVITSIPRCTKIQYCQLTKVFFEWFFYEFDNNGKYGAAKLSSANSSLDELVDYYYNKQI